MVSVRRIATVQHYKEARKGRNEENRAIPRGRLESKVLRFDIPRIDTLVSRLESSENFRIFVSCFPRFDILFLSPFSPQ